ncbi:MAG: carboxypeptidase regulatory-like domain-containing protein [Chloroflexi bacterium]|nr:carboxypeptidase regulatory-like domain-containing protein [Chloroflexota bacterium]
MTRLIVLCLTALAPVALALVVSPTALAGRPQAGPAARVNAPAITVIYPDAFATSAPLSMIAAQAAASPANASSTPVARTVLRRALAGVSARPVAEPSAMLDQPHAPAANMPGLIANFEGASNLENQSVAGRLVYPPDPNGDIGYDPATGRKYYFEWVNLHYNAWDVTDPLAPVVALPATAGNALWAEGLPGSRCALSNSGDPIVLFDEQAHRWFISQFAITGGFHQCVAVSQTADPAGAWYLYDYPYLDGASWFNDYPKFGVWPDPQYGAYYMTVNQFNSSGTAYLGAGAAAFDRQRMLVGDPSAALIVSNLYYVNPNYYSLLPVDLDGPPPPAGTPGLFLSVDDDVFNGLGADAARVWEFRPNWANPPASTFGINGNPNYTLPVASFALLPCANCIPQPGTPVKLDALGDRAMYRAALRDFGGHQSLVVNETVLADGVDRAGVRWYEFQRNPSDGSWSVAQQSTYAPADGIYRWMGSAAMDRQGNLAIGYSAGSTTLYPSIRYAGRLVSDTLSTLPQGEMTMTAGSGYQSGQYGRWGDYSMMGVDPQDGCTFWYTNEYIQTSGLVNWQTRIGSFKFPECMPYAVGSLTGTVISAVTGNPISGTHVIAVDASGIGVLTAQTNGSGTYRLVGIPAGAYTVTASAGGYSTASAPGVPVTATLTTVQNFGLASWVYFVPIFIYVPP